MINKALYALMIGWSFFSFTKVNSTEKEKINWLSLKEVNEKIKIEPKPVIIDLYTNWCYWCKVMDKKTYNNSKVISYINKHFYAVKLNAETKDTLIWKNKEYMYDSGNKINDFALYATQGQLAFPNTIIFGNLESPPASIPGLIEPKEIEVILAYFGEEVYKRKGFNEFAANFKSTW